MSYQDARVIGPNPPQGERFIVKKFSPIPGMEEEEFIKLSDSILFVVPHRIDQGINAGLAENFGWWGRFGLRYAPVRDPHGGYIESLRAGVVRTFLDYRRDRPNIRYLVCCDNDQTIEWDVPYRLARWDLPVVSGVVCSYNSKRGVFCCFTIRDKNGIPRFPSYLHTRKMPESGLVEAHHVGTGLICIRGDVLDKFVEQYKLIDGSQGNCVICERQRAIPFAIPPETRLDGLLTGDLRKGEDIVFSEQCEKLGYKRYVDLSVRASHWKLLPLSWPTEDIDPDLSPEGWMVDDQEQAG